MIFCILLLKKNLFAFPFVMNRNLGMICHGSATRKIFQLKRSFSCTAQKDTACTCWDFCPALPTWVKFPRKLQFRENHNPSQRWQGASASPEERRHEIGR